jgi:hypothetical protein
VAEILALGAVAEEGDKRVTNKIEIVREIPWAELLTLVNTGKGNTGYANSGNRNSGYRNGGNWNQGNFSTGDFNTTDRETGCFCTEEHKIRIFDQESEMSFREWRNSNAYEILCRIPFEPTTWIWASDMTDDEKAAHPEHKVTDGYLRINDTDRVFPVWWDSLTSDEKKIIKGIPNFNPEKFKLITGIEV